MMLLVALVVMLVQLPAYPAYDRETIVQQTAPNQPPSHTFSLDYHILAVCCLQVVSPIWCVPSIQVLLA